MEIITASNPEVAKALEQYFIEDGAYTKAYIASELFEMMATRPKEVIVIVLVEAGELRGFAVAWTVEGMEYIFLNQARYWPGCKRKYGTLAMKKIEKWAIDNHNIHAMRFDTNRNPKALERAWGFKIHSYTMSKVF